MMFGSRLSEEVKKRNGTIFIFSDCTLDNLWIFHLRHLQQSVSKGFVFFLSQCYVFIRSLFL